MYSDLRQLGMDVGWFKAYLLFEESVKYTSLIKNLYYCLLGIEGFWEKYWT